VHRIAGGQRASLDDAHVDPAEIARAQLGRRREAERVEPDSTRVRVHLAAVYQALGNWEAADRYLTLALQDPSDPYVQKHQAILANARRTVDGHIGALELTGGPRGTEILLNGRLVGRLPLQQTIRVQAGGGRHSNAQIT